MTAIFNTEFISPFPVLRTAASLPATPETALRASTVPANSMDLFRRRAALRASYNRLPFYLKTTMPLPSLQKMRDSLIIIERKTVIRGA